MSRTITALFDTKADADAGAERLREAGINAQHVNIHDQATHSQTNTLPATEKESGLWATIKNALVPHEDRRTYEEGLRRGGFLLTVDVDDDQTPVAVRALEEANSVDLDARAQQWRSEGWENIVPAGDLDQADEGVLYGSREVGVGGSRYRSYVPDRR